MASPQSCPGLTTPRPPSNTSRERPSCFAPPSPPSGPVLVDESVASGQIGQHIAAHWASLNPRWTMKLHHLQTIQTSFRQRVSKTWHHDMPQHSAILRSPPHTRPSHPRRQSGCRTNWCSWRTRLFSVPRPRPGGSDRSRLASCSWFYCQNLISEIPRTIDIQLRHVQSLWFKTWKNNPDIHSFNQIIQQYSASAYLLTTQLYQRWTMKLQHLQTIQTSFRQRVSKTWHHDMPQHSAILRSPPHTRPSHPRRQSGCRTNWCLWLTHLSSVPRPRPGGRQMKVGTLFKGSTVKTWSLKSREQLTFNCDMSNLSDSKLGKTIQTSTVSFSNYIQYDILLDCEYLTTQLYQRWMMKLQHLQTIQTSFCQRVSKTWHHDMPQHSAILRSPPHTRPSHPRCQSRSKTNQCLRRTRLSSVLRPRPGGSDRSRFASCQRALRTKPDFWNPANNWHSTETCRISLIQNLEKQSRNPRFQSDHLAIFSIRIFADYSTLSEMNDQTTAPASHPNFFPSKGVQNMTSWHAAAFSDSAEPTTHQAFTPSVPISFQDKSMFATDVFIFSASAKAWRQRQIKVCLLSEGPSDKTWFLKSREQFTFNWDMSNLSDSKLGKTIQKSTVSFSIYIQYTLHTAGLGVFDNSTRSGMNDESTAPANHPSFSL